MKAKSFRDYAEVDVKKLEGYTVANVVAGINAEETGIFVELEKCVDNVVLGIDLAYDPDHEAEGETAFMISDEYVKRIE